MGERVVTINDVLDGHTVLDISCLDRLYLSAFIQKLQTPGGVVFFLHEHRGMPIASPAVFEQIGSRFRDGMRRFAADNHIPVVRFRREDRKVEVMRPYLDRAATTGRSQVAAIGVAQEFAPVWTARKRDTDPAKPPQFSFTKQQRRVTVFYVDVWDDDFGPAFIKLCAWFPYPIKVWVNGHEWAKRQATKAGIGFTELSNGFASAEDPAGLQAICDRLGPGTIRVFFERWMSRLPLPLTTADRDAGFWWDLTMRQVETSRTIVLDAARHTRSFFEALVADNLDLGRPESVELIFKRNPRGRKATGTFKTAIDRHTQGVTVNVFYKHSRIKQYLKDGRALRIETVINDADDLGCQRLLPNLDDLQAKARAINQRLLDSQTGRPGHGPRESSLCADRAAHRHRRWQQGPSLAVRRPSGPGPGRRPGQPAVRRHRHHQPAPARLDDRTARHPLQPEPGQLRPCPATPQRPDHPHPRPPPLHPDPRRHRLRGLLHQGPRPRPQTPACHPQPTPRATRTTRRAPRHRPSNRPTPRPHPAAHRSLTAPCKLMTTVQIAQPKDR